MVGFWMRSTVQPIVYVCSMLHHFFLLSILFGIFWDAEHGENLKLSPVHMRIPSSNGTSNMYLWSENHSTNPPTTKSSSLLCPRPVWVCYVNPTKRHIGIKHKTECWCWEGCTFLVGKHEHLPEPGCLFYRSVRTYKGKDSGKNQALTILDARWKEWGLVG
jgi:hypothetical protein